MIPKRVAESIPAESEMKGARELPAKAFKITERGLTCDWPNQVTLVSPLAWHSSTTSGEHQIVRMIDDYCCVPPTGSLRNRGMG